jgi:ABC-type uncharacterized transport system fused permease/ATPase subunit
MQIESAVGGVRDAWRLAKPYWKSEERWSAWALLLGVITLNLGNVYISVRINEWNKAFYNALQAFNGAAFFRQLGIFAILVAAAIAMSVYALYLKQMLQIRWRRWLTRKYLAAWLADARIIQLQLGGHDRQPRPAISEDLDQFTAYVMNWPDFGLSAAAKSGSAKGGSSSSRNDPICRSARSPALWSTHRVIEQVSRGRG